MTPAPTPHPLESLHADLFHLLERLPHHKHGELIQLALTTLVNMANDEIDRLDWKICNAALRDMEKAFRSFYPYRHTRKIAIFGSARIAPGTIEYEMARKFAERVIEHGFMVITGAGPGIMQAGNEGAGKDQSFGLNIQLPFEQGSNPYVEGDKMVPFKYFFTRKLFFLKESDALAMFPGGFGTQDETFECLTLCQTGKSSPVPLVLVDKPGGHYWHDWDDYIQRQLLNRGLISPEDPSIYTITDDIDVACETIAHFYRVFHSCRYVGNRLVIRLNSELLEEDMEMLNQEFSDILVKGRIEQSAPLPQEAQDATVGVSRILLYFNQRDLGRLYQLINTINAVGLRSEATERPERK
ncbi:MAG TPA: LOG family protein [Leptolyngbyaceae cyanobacterium M33_DOE_097]|uniref:LOG family protein n=1 Tax=Oscillatoriales cyanobacterium SpSt-418 TaxID=2282169 RepID=A0A7C3KFA6_9CYAN|nr:LOG family protein [Leptolyngbyaceae cyanobacterium M33_DOE_097]